MKIALQYRTMYHSILYLRISQLNSLEYVTTTNVQTNAQHIRSSRSCLIQGPSYRCKPLSFTSRYRDSCHKSKNSSLRYRYIPKIRISTRTCSTTWITSEIRELIQIGSMSSMR